jgi:AraC family transcriptional regulator
MQWSELFNDGHKPPDYQIKKFVGTPLWDDLAYFLHQTYKIKPELFFSCCSMQNGFWKGWNVKYKKSGKSLCTLYPKQGYFITLIPIGARATTEVELLIPQCDEYIQKLYHQTALGTYGKSLAIEVTNKSILRDVKNLIVLRYDSR